MLISKVTIGLVADRRRAGRRTTVHESWTDTALQQIRHLGRHPLGAMPDAQSLAAGLMLALRWNTLSGS
jgi:hypothetical protein